MPEASLPAYIHASAYSKRSYNTKRSSPSIWQNCSQTHSHCQLGSPTSCIYHPLGVARKTTGAYADFQHRPRTFANSPAD
jgi:hypothetical protein